VNNKRVLAVKGNQVVSGELKLVEIEGVRCKYIVRADYMMQIGLEVLADQMFIYRNVFCAVLWTGMCANNYRFEA